MQTSIRLRAAMQALGAEPAAKQGVLDLLK